MARFVRVPSASTDKMANGRVCRRDATGHIDPGHEQRLLKLARGGRNPDGDADSTHAFIAGRKTKESIGEELGEAFLESATSGEPSEVERLDQVTEDEDGGPFVTTLAEEEFAVGPDESGSEGDAREPFPTSSSALPRQDNEAPYR